MKIRSAATVTILLMVLVGTFPARAWAGGTEIPVGGIFDLAGPTAVLGRAYAQGVMDAIFFLNQQGGVDGRALRLVAEDYGADVPKALHLYQKQKNVDKVLAIQGWGAADTTAISPLAAKDQIVYFSASGEACLTDPRKAPYNFGLLASYSDQVRLAVRFAQESGGKKISFIYPDHPFGREPIPAGKEYAQKLGLEVGPDALVGLRATEALAALGKIKEFDPDYTWAGGTTPSTAVILADATKLGLKTRFLVGQWGLDETLPTMGVDNLENRVFGMMGVRPFGFEVPETAKIKQIAGAKIHPFIYHQGWAAMMVLGEGLLRAERLGQMTGPGIKAALETLKDFDTGGLTPPLTYTADDHRPTTTCGLFTFREGRLVLVTDLTIERKPEYLGW